MCGLGAGPVGGQMNQIKVSVLVPVFDGEAYVGKAIRSILASEFQDYEVVVLDDGSQDSSAKVARSFGDKRVRVYRRDQHEGIAATRNHLLIAAKAPMVAWLDADDVSFPERLGKQVAYLERHTDVAVVSCGYVEIDAQGQNLRQRSVPLQHEDLDTRLLQAATLPTSTLMARRASIDAVGGFAEDMEIGSEHDLILQIAEKSRLGAVREPLVKCRVHARAVSYTQRHPHREGLEEARRRAVLRRHRRNLTLVGATPAETTDDEIAVVETTAAATDADVIDAAMARVAATIASSDDHETTTDDPGQAPTTGESGSNADAEDDVTEATLETATTAEATAGNDGAEVTIEADATDETDDVAVHVEASDNDSSDGPRDGATAEVEAVAATADDEPADDAEIDATVVATVVANQASTGDEPAALEEVTAQASTETDDRGTTDIEETPVVEIEAEPAEEAATREAAVAVVLPTENVAGLEAVRSVLDQTLADFVLAVVAAEPEDGLVRGLEMLNDDRILLLTAPGAGRARLLNLGILATRSRYLAYLAEGSQYRSEHLEQIVEIADQERLGLLYADLGLATKGVEGAAVNGHDFDAELLLKENYIPTEAVLHRRDLLFEVGLFNEGLDAGMEWELWVYLTRIGTARRHAEVTVERVVGSSRTTKARSPSPARVRRFLAERFAHASVENQPAMQISRDEVSDNPDAVQRAQLRFRRGDWAGAASELVEVAARPFTALSQLFHKTYPERELSSLPTGFGSEPTLESRRRDPAAQRAELAITVADGVARATADMSAVRAGVHLGAEPSAAAAREQLRAAATNAPAQRSNNRRNSWLYVQSGLVGTGRGRTTASERGLASPRVGGVRPLSNAIGRSRRKAMSTLVQNPPCPRCGKLNPTLAHRSGWYRILDCGSCGVAFSHPRLDASKAVRFFSDRGPSMVPPNLRSVDDLSGTQFDRARELSWVKRHVPDGRLLDVGCGWGYAVAQARRLGYDAFGTELSRSLARIAHERFDIEIHERDLQDMKLAPLSIDVVLVLHVLQHMLDPLGFLGECRRVLRSGGVVVGTVPNFDAYLREKLGRRWAWLDPESQAFHWRPAVLGRELDALGFDVEMWTSEGRYGPAALIDLLGEDEATKMERQGRGSEIGFIARRRR